MKKLNIGEFSWWLLLGALILSIGKLLVFDELKFYLHPKMFPFVIAAEIILIILFIHQQSRVFSDRSSKFRVGYFIFLIPLFMLVMAGDASGIIFQNRTINLNGLPQKEVAKKSDENAQKEAAPAPELSPVYQNLAEGEMNSPDPNATDPTDPNAPKIIADDPFLTTLFALGEDPENKEIMLEGFVYREESFSKEQFFVSRMLVNCCAADAELVGLVTQTPLAQNFNDNDWVRVKGVTKMKLVKNPYTQEDEERIVLEVSEIEKMEPLETPYVYFSF